MHAACAGVWAVFHARGRRVTNGDELTTARAADARGRRIAVLVPCFNEEAAIAKVVADFRAVLPAAAIYVYDNNSTDRTVEVARAAGAVVRRETHQGKGNVVRRMFADVDAEVYVLVDGDATYDAPSARAMIARLIEDRLDMVVAARVEEAQAAYRRGHRTGNRLLTAFVASVFGASFTDILSGYRVFSRRFVKSFPVLSLGFAIPIFVTYFEQGAVPRVPTAILSTGLMLLAFLSVIAGLVLDTVTKGRREMKLLAYLEQRSPGEDWERRQL